MTMTIADKISDLQNSLEIELRILPNDTLTRIHYLRSLVVARIIDIALEEVEIEKKRLRELAGKQGVVFVDDDPNPRRVSRFEMMEMIGIKK
jgi:hypothetical protein